MFNKCMLDRGCRGGDSALSSALSTLNERAFFALPGSFGSLWLQLLALHLPDTYL